MPKTTHQIVLVLADSWSSGQARLARFQRGDKGPWKRVGNPVDVVLGASGLGWGAGLHPAQNGPRKQEGDGRSPAGVFRISEALGYDRVAPATRLPYRAITPRLRCVDDPRSKAYNQLLEEPEGANRLWQSAERMRRDDELYARVVVIAHNAGPVVAGQGSCIFLHVWGGPQTRTSGWLR